MILSRGSAHNRLDDSSTSTHSLPESETKAAPFETAKTPNISVYPSLPFIRRPLADEDGPWLKQGHEASAWLSLFYGETTAWSQTPKTEGRETESGRAREGSDTEGGIRSDLADS